MFKFYINEEDEIINTTNSKNSISISGRYRRGRYFEVSDFKEFPISEGRTFEVEEGESVEISDCMHTDGVTTEKAFNEENHVYFCSFVDWCCFSSSETCFTVEMVYDKSTSEFRRPTKEEKDYCDKFSEMRY